MARYRSPTAFDFVEEHCYDLSRGGMFMQSRAPAPVGTLLKLECEVDGGAEAIRGVARVAWVRDTDGESGPAGMGVKFVKLEQGSRDVIERVLEQSGANEAGGQHLRGSRPPPQAAQAAAGSEAPAPTPGRFNSTLQWAAASPAPTAETAEAQPPVPASVETAVLGATSPPSGRTSRPKAGGLRERLEHSREAGSHLHARQPEAEADEPLRATATEPRVMGAAPDGPARTVNALTPSLATTRADVDPPDAALPPGLDPPAPQDTAAPDATSEASPAKPAEASPPKPAEASPAKPAEATATATAPRTSGARPHASASPAGASAAAASSSRTVGLIALGLAIVVALLVVRSSEQQTPTEQAAAAHVAAAPQAPEPPPAPEPAPPPPEPAPPPPYVIEVVTIPPGARVRAGAQSVIAPGELVLGTLEAPLELQAELEGFLPTSMPIARDGFEAETRRRTLELALEADPAAEAAAKARAEAEAKAAREAEATAKRAAEEAERARLAAERKARREAAATKRAEEAAADEAKRQAAREARRKRAAERKAASEAQTAEAAEKAAAARARRAARRTAKAEAEAANAAGATRQPTAKAEPAPAASAQTPMEAAAACLAKGDNACVVKALQGKATSARELELLIETYRSMGNQAEAEKSMQRYLAKYPNERRATAYQHVLELRGHESQ